MTALSPCHYYFLCIKFHAIIFSFGLAEFFKYSQVFGLGTADSYVATHLILVLLIFVETTLFPLLSFFLSSLTAKMDAWTDFKGELNPENNIYIL